MRSVFIVAASVLALLCLCSTTAAGADVIVLKSGRRIVVLAATEKGDQVTGEMQEGEITLPKSLVERIEHHPAESTSGKGGRSASAETLSIAPPSRSEAGSLSGADPGATSGAVHGGKVDTAYISNADLAAGGGTPEALLRAAAAHNAAALFEADHGNIDSAIEQEQHALRFQPENTSVLLNLGYYHLRRSEFSAALDYLDRAKRLAPDSPDAAKLLGWANYGLNRIPEAVTEWKRAQLLRPDPEVAQALQKAQRDAEAESQFREGQTNHFVLRYSGDETSALAHDILDTLEEDFDSIRDSLRYTPPEPIGVILYTDQEFAGIAHAPSWVGAVNDGRIRVPVQGLSTVNEALARELKHELTHSFLQQKTSNRCPTWLQEGIAQWMEGSRSRDSAAALVAAYDSRTAIPLRDLEVSWMNLSTEGASLAYSWSLAVVETIIETGGMSDLNRLLDAISAKGATEAAVRQVLHEDYFTLESQTAAYLRRAYLGN
jgi:tetratricopeptide (TPR) repeat protein